MNGKLPTGRILLSACLFLLVLAETAWLHLLQPLENRVGDAMLRWHAAALRADPDIVIVDINNASMDRMQAVAGNWPWPRAVHAELIEGLARQKPRAIVFDILFSERDVYRPDSDRLFNDALEGKSNVYFPMIRLDPSADVQGPLMAQAGPLLGIAPAAQADMTARVALLPPQAVDPRHWRVGVINFTEDRDGIGRRYVLHIPVKGWSIPSLPVRVGRDLGFPIPPGDDMVLGWRGKREPYRRVDYANLFDDFGRGSPQRSPTEFRDKIVIIGSTATGLHDIRSTPVDSRYGGVDILATAIDNLKNDGALHAAPEILGSVWTLLLMASIWTTLHYRKNILGIGLALLPVSVALLGLSYAALYWRLLLPVAVPLMFVWLFYVGLALAEYLQEKRKREQAVRLFSRFLNPHVVQQLVGQGRTVASLSGQSHQISVLFSDIRGFTTLSEAHPPQQIVELLNRYFSLQVAVIFRHGGTLDKFIGDAIMAFWGAPLDDPEHARHAVQAALEMTQVLGQFKRDLGELGHDFDVGIGIHSGAAVVGFIGAEQKLDYTAIGDTVNLSSRIEGLTKGVARILVSQATRDACAEAFEFKAHGSYKVKGRNAEVELYEPLEPASQ